MKGKLIGDLPEKRILVTGAPRSATTFVGRVLSWPRQVDYVHEPLNPQCGLPSLDTWYADLATIEGGERLRDEFEALLRYEPMLHTGYYARDRGLARRLKPLVGSRGPFFLRLGRVNPFTEAVVVKDPFAVFSMATFVERWGFRIVALVRHPLAFVGSVDRLGWSLDGMLAGLRAQPAILERLDPGDRVALEGDLDPAHTAALLWRITTREVARVADATDDVRLLTHESINEEPVARFRSLYAELGLPWSRWTTTRIERATSGDRAEAAGGRTQDFSRDSRALLAHRLGALDSERRDAIWAEVADLATRWYTPEGVRAARTTS